VDKEIKLTPKQRAFCDYYIESKGNARQAAIKAGYSEKTAAETGYENLNKPHIAQYIAERMKPDEENRIASAKEVAEYLSAVMRGEVPDQFGLDATIKDRTDASIALGKMHGIFVDKKEVSVSSVQIVDDVPDEETS
jgi:phage terminase small subunit